jgi:hypothetical protein
MSRMLVACGGSGDLITALSLIRSQARDDTVILATPVWERFAVDPHPGPRDHDDMANLARVNGGWRITARSSTPGGYSPLPKFSATCGLPLLFLDLTTGALGMRDQLERIVHAHDLDDVELVDTGGDALACGTEPGIASPATDALLMAAARALPCRTWVTCAGLGLDGELTRAELNTAISKIPAVQSSLVPSAVAERLYAAYQWFPSEASLITLLAAKGHTGTVDLSEKYAPVAIDRSTAMAHTFHLRPLAERNRFAHAVADSSSFLEADLALQKIGARSEYQSELNRSAADTQSPVPMPDLATVLRQAAPVRADFVSLRRLARSSGLNSRQGHLYLEQQLTESFGRAYQSPILCSDATRQRPIDLFLTGISSIRSNRHREP